MPVVLVTGAGRGLGLEFARQYAAAGWSVIGTVRNPAAASALLALGDAVRVLPCDVADRATIAGLARDLAGAPIDVLICNAGIYGPRGQAFGATDYGAWEDLLRVNLLGPVAVAEALVENVQAGRLKKMIMMSSLMGSIARNDDGRDYAYRTSKAALNQAVKSLAPVLAPRGITIIAASPGWVKTDMGGAQAPLSATESVAGLRQVIAGLTPESNGRFLRYDGSEVPW